MRYNRIGLTTGLALVALLGCRIDAVALTPLRAVEFTTDLTVDLSGNFVKPGEGAIDFTSFAFGYSYPGWSTSLVGTTGYGRGANQDFLLAFDAAALHPLGYYTFQPGDVARLGPPYDYAYTLPFSPRSVGIPPGVLTDAIADYGEELLLSFDTTVSLPSAAGGTFTAGKEDLVIAIAGTNMFMMFFDPSSAGIPAGMNLDGAYYLHTTGSRLFVSFDGSGNIGGVSFDKEDVIEYNFNTDTYHLAYDGEARHAGWPPANLLGLGVELANLTVGGGRIVGRPGGSACLSPFLNADGTLVRQMEVSLSPVAGQIDSLSSCNVSPAIPGGGVSFVVGANTVGAGASSLVVPLPDGILVSCAIRINSTLTAGTYNLDAAGFASSPDFAEYSPITTLPASLIVTNCDGDCDGNGSVSIGETVRAVNLFLGAPLCRPGGINTTCAASDADSDRSVTLGEVQHTVNRMLQGCPADSAAKRMFVTSTTHTGNLGGLAGADAICGARATAAGLSGTYKAWLSSESASAASRLTHRNGPYTLIDGTVVAYGWNDLTDGTLLAAIIRTESFGNATDFWTGTEDNGIPIVGGTCSGWTSTAGQGQGGTPDLDTHGWSTSFDSACSVAHALLCIEQ